MQNEKDFFYHRNEFVHIQDFVITFKKNFGALLEYEV